MIVCPNCEENQIVKNGFVYDEKQNFKCKTCGQQNQVSVEKRKLIGKLL